MAGAWIKMRRDLIDNPKVVAITRILMAERDFREWLTPGGGGPVNGDIVRHGASRRVTVASLLCVWSAAREHGKFEGDDLHLAHTTIDDVDELAGVPGFGRAMESVEWVLEREDGGGIILPNFKEFNVPLSDAERAHSYRERSKRGVTQSSRTTRDGNGAFVTPRADKSREELEPSLRSGSGVCVVEDLPPTNPTPSQVPPGTAERARAGKRVNGHSRESHELLAFLNARAGKSFRAVDANLRLIDARLASGVPPIRVRQVILRKCREWSAREDMAGYLRPATLFSPTNFEQYLGEIPVGAEALKDFFPEGGEQ